MKSKQQGNVFGSVGKQFGGIAKAAAKRVVQEPMEVLKTAVGVKSGEGGDGQEDNQAMPTHNATHNEAGKQAMEQTTVVQQNNQAGGQVGDQNVKPSQPKGFRTKEDFDKYVEGSENRDKLKLRMERRKLEQEWGVGEGVEQGMERVRQERDQKEEENEQVEEQEKQQAEAMKYEKEKQENEQVKAAKEGASAEKRGKMG